MNDNTPLIRCKKCGAYLPRDRFPPSTYHKRGHRNECRGCYAEYQKLRRDRDQARRIAMGAPTDERLPPDIMPMPFHPRPDRFHPQHKFPI